MAIATFIRLLADFNKRVIMYPLIRLVRRMLVVTASAVGILGQQSFAQCHDPPGPNEITVWEGIGFTGTCQTLRVGLYPNASALSPVHGDSISSIKVGKNVRAYLYQYPNYGGSVALYEAGSSHDAGRSGDFWLGPHVNGQTTSIIVRPTGGVRVPYIFINDFPSDVENSFSEEVQGMCHDASSWLITRNHFLLFSQPFEPPTSTGALLKIPLSSDLRTAQPIAKALIPPFLRQKGYNHMGDPDCMNGFVFVPIEGIGHVETSPAAVAVFNASDLSFVNWDVLYINEDHHGPWVAIDPADGVSLWSSGTGNVHGKFYVYTIDWSQVVPRGSFIFASAGVVGPYRNRFGASLRISGLQGGAFNTSGTVLFVTNSGHDSPDGHGLWALNKNTGELIGESSNDSDNNGGDYGPFRYRTPHDTFPSCGGFEEEGLDYFPTNHSITPGIDGQLHAILLNNDCITADNFYMKHYELFQDQD